MAATQSYATTLHEQWYDSTAQVGGAAQILTTHIPVVGLPTSLYNVQDTLRLDVVTGNPAFTVAYSASAGGYLVVTITNTAGGGAANQATWTYDVLYLNTIVQ
jgi:hypothetical protein